MFDDIERRRFLEHPARKHLAPFFAHGIFDDHLNKGTGQLFLFPRLGLIARAQPHDEIADMHRFTGLHREIA
jgi:hypothetical protein